MLLRARYVFPVTGPPIPGGVIEIDGERIVSVGASVPPGGKPIDLGNVAILPGLVNAHTHLELSDVTSPLGTPGMALPDWIRLVLKWRRDRSSAADYSPRAVIQRGCQESLRHGVTTVCDIAQGPSIVAVDPPPDVVSLLEVIALGADRAEAALQNARRWLESQTAGQPIGLSPHSPYSVHPRLLEELVELSRTYRVPVAMHVAESLQETELLRTGGGPMHDLLFELGAWDEAAIPRMSLTSHYTRRLAKAHKALVVHVNYFYATEDLQILVENADRMTLVHCPRTHAYFQHPVFRLAEILVRGVRVALGTDSRASNPDLSILEEMRFVARRHTNVSPDDVLRLGTLDGATALGRGAEVGSLEPGKRADLAVVTLPDRDAADPHKLLFDSNLGVAGTWYRGKKANAEFRMQNAN